MLLVFSFALPAMAGPVVRGQLKLDRALRAALSPLHQRKHPVPVLFVVDATPYTKAAAIVLAEALHALTDKPGRLQASQWRLARLGKAAGPGRPAAAALSADLQRVLAKTQREVSTLSALRRTLRSFGARGGVIVYIADWHFEDDDGLEAMIAGLKGRGQTLSVLGSEAAFEHGWNTGIDAFGREQQQEQIGRDPFRGTRARPWHGGETAYPHVPWLFGGTGWKTEFGRPARVAGLDSLRDLMDRKGLPGGNGFPGKGAGKKPDERWPEDVRERLQEIEDKQPRRMFRYPLPSAFGPYALMRAAAETGGKYVLWPWNAGGRAFVRYDYTRCDRFAPDLRSRTAILRDINRRSLARALGRAWHILADADIAELTCPLAPNLASSREIAPTFRTNRLPFAWPTRAQHTEFLRRAGKMRDAANRALKILFKAIRGAGEPDNPVDRRYLADAHLVAQIALTQSFSLGEALAAAKKLPKNAFKDKDTFPGLAPVVWIPPTPQDETPTARHDRIAQKKRGARVLADRVRYLKRYRRTPFGEIVRRNEVNTYELTRRKKLKPSRGNGPPGTPAFSDNDPTPAPATPPAGGGSAGGGPTSGG